MPHDTQCLGERLGSGDGERKKLLTRLMAFEPLPASVMFGVLGAVIAGLRHLNSLPWGNRWRSCEACRGQQPFSGIMNMAIAVAKAPSGGTPSTDGSIEPSFIFGLNRRKMTAAMVPRSIKTRLAKGHATAAMYIAPQLLSCHPRKIATRQIPRLTTTNQVLKTRAEARLRS